MDSKTEVLEAKILVETFPMNDAVKNIKDVLKKMKM